MRVKVSHGLALAGLLALAALIWLGLFGESEALLRWAIAQQRGFQNLMAGAIRALRMGDWAALAVLFGAAGAYGFVHALGPGHGKFLIGSLGFGTSISARRLLSVAVLSSLAQSLWAIVLVYGGFFFLELSAHRMTALAEEYLAPASYLAIAVVGVILVWRGGTQLCEQSAAQLQELAQEHDTFHEHNHGPTHTHDPEHHDCGCSHAHGPTPEQIAALGSLRDAVLLIASIAVRPCTGAIFLLVIAWNMQIKLAGAAAVVVMGMGTAGLTVTVALSSVAARSMAQASAQALGQVALALSVLQILAGGLLVWACAMLLALTL